jgi:hypothetical protein
MYRRMRRGTMQRIEKQQILTILSEKDPSAPLAEITRDIGFNVSEATAGRVLRLFIYLFI